MLVTAPASSVANNTSVDYFMFPLVFIIWPMKDLASKGSPMLSANETHVNEEGILKNSTDQKYKEALTKGWAWA